jgi:hypothetical protein
MKSAAVDPYRYERHANLRRALGSDRDAFRPSLSLHKDYGFF